jgi:methylated-DNA-protein-cysteine methyltransferase-like protein
MSVSLSAAHRRILECIRAVPSGRVAHYGLIAAQAGLPGRARLVGRLLRESDDPNLPWHRILRAGGYSAFAQGSALYREQRRRLAVEGVRLVRGRVNLAQHGLRVDLDALLWGPPPPRAQRRRNQAATE